MSYNSNLPFKVGEPPSESNPVPVSPAMWNAESLVLANNISATGPERVVDVGGTYIISVQASFSGGSLFLETIGPDDVTWVPVSGVVFTANGQLPVKCARGARIRLARTGSPTAIFGKLTRASD